jgi:TatD DNase family protein
LPGLIDSHCHLDYAPASEDLEATFERARAAGIEALLHIGCSPERFDPALELAANSPEQGPRVFTVLGVHPHDATTLDASVLARLEREYQRDEVVAIGEMGLDYHYDRSPREVQRDAFGRQLDLARKLDAPIVLHIRDAHEDAWEVVAAHPPRENDPGVVHCFTGTPAEAQRWVELGFCISFSGIATFRTAPGLREAARACPPDRILVETDAPFLAPEPMRGRKNEPANVAFTCSRLAAERGESAQELATRAAQNTRRLFDLPEPEPIADRGP